MTTRVPPGWSYDPDTDTIHTTPALAERSPRAHGALVAWCEAHDLDPHLMPQRNRITRDAAARTISYDGWHEQELEQSVGRENGPPPAHRFTEELATEPAPFPTLITGGR